jgi:tRNA 2-selenouridine synthase
MSKILEITAFLNQATNLSLVDVRSPSEFTSGHIPGAVNIPLFSDEERKAVGILYKNSGRSLAIHKGFEIVAAKYSQLIEEAKKTAVHNTICLYCWRGGMRSGTLGWLYERQNYKIYLLKGGYKSYRTLVRSYFSQSLNLNVLGGKTGSGKTEILEEMKRRDHQVVNLETLAHHKGSAFGKLGESEQPTNEQFENNLLSEFMKFDPEKPIWIEDESRSIGKVFIPPELFLQMQDAFVFFLDVPIEKRIERLIKIYSSYNYNELRDCFQKIGRKIGGQHLIKALEYLDTGNFRDAAKIALKYYDKTYQYGLKKKNKEKISIVYSNKEKARENADLLEQKLNKQVS